MLDVKISASKTIEYITTFTWLGKLQKRYLIKKAHIMKYVITQDSCIYFNLEHDLNPSVKRSTLSIRACRVKNTIVFQT